MNATKAHYCPSCKRLLYDRTLAHCGHCGSAIPEELRFSAAELAKLEAERKKWEEAVARGGLMLSKPPQIIPSSDNPIPFP